MTHDARFALAALLICLSALGLARDLDPPPRVDKATPLPPVASPAAAALRRGEPIDLNLATSGDLRLLPGIGPKVADRIVAHRAEHGAFRDVGQLRDVRGIGEKTYARIEKLVRVTSKKVEGARAAQLHLRGGPQVGADQQHAKPDIGAEQPCP